MWLSLVWIFVSLEREWIQFFHNFHKYKIPFFMAKLLQLFRIVWFPLISCFSFSFNLGMSCDNLSIWWCHHQDCCIACNLWHRAVILKSLIFIQVWYEIVLWCLHIFGTSQVTVSSNHLPWTIIFFFFLYSKSLRFLPQNLMIFNVDHFTFL